MGGSLDALDTLEACGGRWPHLSRGLRSFSICLSLSLHSDTKGRTSIQTCRCSRVIMGMLEIFIATHMECPPAKSHLSMSTHQAYEPAGEGC